MNNMPECSTDEKIRNIRHQHQQEILLYIEAARTVLEFDTFKSVAHRLFDACRKITGAKSGYVALLSDSGLENEVLFLESGGLPCLVNPALPMPIRGLRAEAYEKGKTVFENKFMSSKHVEFMPAGHVELRNVMFVPMKLDGKVLGIMGLANKESDFTDDDALKASIFGDLAAIAFNRSRATELIKEEFQKTKDILNAIPSGLFIYKYAEPDKLILEFGNHDAQLLTGINPARWIGREFDEIWPAAKETGITEKYLNVIRSGENVELEDVQYTDDRLSGAFRVRVFNIPGKRLGVAFENITKTKKAETELKKLRHESERNQKLESLGVLAGGIAHDFNNLLGGIFGYIDMASENINDNKAANYLSKALATIGRARGLTQQLLTFAKGGEPVKKAEMLNPLIEEAVRFVSSGSNISPVFNFQKDLWVCECDRNQIGQVIDNMIINAQQAMPSGGKIEIVTENVVPLKNGNTILADGNYVKISIRDQGTGISSDMLPKIFDPFFTTKAKGHGLGLATCYSIINRHGGFIDVESEPDKGTTFSIYLPATTTTGKESLSSNNETYQGSGTVLIMDDEEVIRETIGGMLSSLGFNVIEATNGSETITIFKSFRNSTTRIVGMIFDLTIQGGMGGKETISEIRKIDSLIPVFVSSGYSADPVVSSPETYGFTASICKPFRKTELAEMLRKHIKTA